MTIDDAILLAELAEEAYGGSSAFRTNVQNWDSQLVTKGKFFQPQGVRESAKKSILDGLTTASTATSPGPRRRRGRIPFPKIRLRIFERDKGICALCGLNTIHFDHAIRYVRSHVERYHWDIVDHRVYWEDQFAAFLRALGIRASKWPDVLWEADHITPVCKWQGKLYGVNSLGNLRTLCLACHRRETNRVIYGHND